MIHIRIAENVNFKFWVRTDECNWVLYVLLLLFFQLERNWWCHTYLSRWLRTEAMSIFYELWAAKHAISSFTWQVSHFFLQPAIRLTGFCTRYASLYPPRLKTQRTPLIMHSRVLRIRYVREFLFLLIHRRRYICTGLYNTTYLFG